MSSLTGTFAETWRAFRDRIEAIGPARLATRTSGGWSVQEMLGHVAFWFEAPHYVIPHMLRGEPEPASFVFGSGYDGMSETEWPRDDVHNAREAAWATDRTPEEVLERLDAAHSALATLLASVTDDELAANRTYFEGLAGHLDEHALELDEAALAGLLDDVHVAHAEAFAATNGEDPEWARWYADRLAPSLAQFDVPADDLAEVLTRLDASHRTSASEEPWTSYYARRMLGR